MAQLMTELRERKIQAKPRFYKVDITIGKGTNPIVAGENGLSSITIQNVSFILKRLSYQFISPNGLSPAANPLSLVPDSFLNVIWRTDSHVYATEPTSIAAMMGNPQNIRPIDLPSPVELQPKATVTFEVSTQLPRLYPITIQLVLAGVEPLSSSGDLV